MAIKASKSWAKGAADAKRGGASEEASEADVTTDAVDESPAPETDVKGDQDTDAAEDQPAADK
jgi:hypothetical protein